MIEATSLLDDIKGIKIIKFQKDDVMRHPLVFKINEPGDIKSKEERIKKVAYLPIGEFLKKCSYENVKTMIIEAISK